MSGRITHAKIGVLMVLVVWMTAAMFLAGTVYAQEKAGAGRPKCPLAYGTGPYGPGEKLDATTDEISRRLFQKRAEMIAMMAAPEVNEAAVRALHKEINELCVQRADRMLEDALQYKKENPNWQPRFWGSCCGRPCGEKPGRGFKRGSRP
jgi:hypothetical protein